jgi:hypothetical protein
VLEEKALDPGEKTDGTRKGNLACFSSNYDDDGCLYLHSGWWSVVLVDMVQVGDGLTLVVLEIRVGKNFATMVACEIAYLDVMAMVAVAC